MDWDNLVADTEDILTVHFSGGRDGHTLDKVIVHYNDGNLTVEDCHRVWQSREASAHYQVEESGRIGQLVYDADTSWNCGKWVPNCESIGIEHANRSDGTISDACLDAGAHLVAAVCRKYGLGRPEWLTNVFPHRYFVSTSCPGEIYGSQKDAYISRAQDWYDKMAGATAAAPTTGGRKRHMECIITNLQATGVCVYFDGARLHDLTDVDDITVLNTIHNACFGTDIPCFQLDGDESPWTSRLYQALYSGAPTALVPGLAGFASRTPKEV